MDKEQNSIIKAIKNARPVFKSQEAYEAYRKEYKAAIVPILKKQSKAHQISYKRRVY